MFDRQAFNVWCLSFFHLINSFTNQFSVKQMLIGHNVDHPKFVRSKCEYMEVKKLAPKTPLHPVMWCSRPLKTPAPALNAEMLNFVALS